MTMKNTAYVLNFYPSRAEYVSRGDNYGFGGFGSKDFTGAEKAELRAAMTSLGGNMRFLPGGGPGAPGTVGLRGVEFATESDADTAATQILNSLSPTLRDRLKPRVRTSPKKWGG